MARPFPHLETDMSKRTTPPADGQAKTEAQLAAEALQQLQTGEQPAGEPVAGEQTAGEPVAGEQPAGEPVAGEQPAAEHPQLGQTYEYQNQVGDLMNLFTGQLFEQGAWVPAEHDSFLDGQVKAGRLTYRTAE